MPVYFGDDRRQARRFGVQIPARLNGILVYNSGSADNASGNVLRVLCETRDVSETGLALAVPAGQLNEYYLPRESCLMLVLLELPGGPVALEATPMHYQLVRRGDAGAVYLIGASIHKISEQDRDRYLEYLSTLDPA